MNHSEQLNELATALSKAQGQIKDAKKDSSNPFFKSKYADLASVWDACRKPLSDNGLSIVQGVEFDANGRYLETMLMHTSGQYVSSIINLTLKEDSMQSIGSAITYARRYALSAMVGVSPDDDDGEAAGGRMVNQQPTIQYGAPPITKPLITTTPAVEHTGGIDPTFEPTEFKNTGEFMLAAKKKYNLTPSQVEAVLGRTKLQFNPNLFSEWENLKQKMAAGAEAAKSKKVEVK